MKVESINETLELVAEGALIAPSSFPQEKKEDLQQICNGCGAAGATFDFVPDTIYGVDISHVCNIHDYEYNIGTTDFGKTKGDLRFLMNLMRCIEAVSGWKKVLKPLMRRRALKYYEAVTAFGHNAYWEGK